MKSIIVNKIKNEFGIRNIGGRKLECIKFRLLCNYYDRLKAGEDLK